MMMVELETDNLQIYYHISLSVYASGYTVAIPKSVKLIFLTNFSERENTTSDQLQNFLNENIGVDIFILRAHN